MSDLYLTAIQPNPPGRDAMRPGLTTNVKLNEEWVEFRVNAARNLTGDSLSQLVFDNYCRMQREEVLITFPSIAMAAGQAVRVHTGSGTAQWIGNALYVYLGRSWFVWNNACGDRATLRYSGNVIDSAAYRPNPPEGVLYRVQGTELFEGGVAKALGWR